MHLFVVNFAKIIYANLIWKSQFLIYLLKWKIQEFYNQMIKIIMKYTKTKLKYKHNLIQK